MGNVGNVILALATSLGSLAIAVFATAKSWLALQLQRRKSQDHITIKKGENKFEIDATKLSAEQIEGILKNLGHEKDLGRNEPEGPHYD